MTEAQKQQIHALATSTPASLLWYWPFFCFLLLFGIGVIIQVILVTVCKEVFEVELLWKSGNAVEAIYDSGHLRRLALVSSQLFVINFGLMAILAAMNYKMRRLLLCLWSERQTRDFPHLSSEANDAACEVKSRQP